jgi:hypothetical protein
LTTFYSTVTCLLQNIITQKHRQADIFFAGINRLLHPHHKHVSRLDRVERHRIFNPDDSSQRFRQHRHILRLLHKMVHNSPAQSSSTNSSHNNTSRSPADTADKFQETTTCNSSSSWLCHDLPRRNRLPNSVPISKFWNTDLAPTKWKRYHPLRGRNISGHCLGSSYLYNCWTNWRRDYS